MNETLSTKLKELGLTDEQIALLAGEGVSEASDMALLTEDQIKSTTNCGLIVAKKIVQEFAPAPPETTTMNVSLDVLPAVPTDDNWLASLKVGGVLKFNRETVIGTVSAGLAQQVGLYDLPRKLVTAMETHAQSLEEPVSAEFYAMQRTLTERSYGEIFAAIPGVTGRYATDARKKELLEKLNTRLWPSLIGFHEQLTGWVSTWQANPNMMVAALASIAGGGSMPPGMMAPPPTETLRDAAEGVITSINSVFAGTGVVVAMALAYDAQQIRSALEDPNLPSQVGAANREQMLRQLGVAVSSDYPRLEANLKRYTLGVIELPNVTAGNEELAFITALYQLGMAIPWAKLNGGRAGLGSQL
ncbi:MAG: hypothetical protein V4682_00825 [Patescibacteria group bacterium]